METEKSVRRVLAAAGQQQQIVTSMLDRANQARIELAARANQKSNGSTLLSIFTTLHSARHNLQVLQNNALTQAISNSTPAEAEKNMHELRTQLGQLSTAVKNAERSLTAIMVDVSEIATSDERTAFKD